MEHFLLTLLTMFTFASVCFPQGMTDKGSMSLSGSAFLSYKKYNDGAIDRKFSIEPGVSYFPSGNFEIGINARITYSHYTETFEYISNPDDYFRIKETGFVDSRMYGLGVFMSKYLGKNEAKPFITGSVAYSYVSFSPSDIYYFENPVTALTITFAMGYLIPLNKNIALTPLLQYHNLMYQQGTEKRYPMEQIQDEQGVSLGMQLKIFFNDKL